MRIRSPCHTHLLATPQHSQFRAFVNAQHTSKQSIHKGCTLKSRGRISSSPAETGSDRPYRDSTLEELKDRLELTVRAEDYKVAAAIRDEINRRVGQADEAVREANQRFYDAFGNGDIKAMERIWGEGSHVKVMHPGSEGIYGKADVMESWRLILGGGGMNIQLEQVQVYTSDSLAMVTCIEVMRSSDAQGRTAATNILERQNGRWVIIHHQGGPLIPRRL